MPLTKQEWLDLEAKANQLRHTALDTTSWRAAAISEAA